MPSEFDTVEKTFAEIKRLASADPFEPFYLRIDGEEIPVEHPNCIGFHPEVPYVNVFTRDNTYRAAVKHVRLIREQYSP